MIGFHYLSGARIVMGIGIFLSLTASIASAYDYGCQYLWEEPSPDNNLIECLKGLPRNNPGVLVPPIIPALLFVFVFITYPIIFLCRIFGGCGSNTQRPGTGCCCEGGEWDAVDDAEKSKLYPRRYVCFIKVLCVIVVACSVIPIIITPIGFKYGMDFWDSIYDQTETEIIGWAEKEKDILQNELSMGDGTYVPPLNESTFDGFDDIIDTFRNKIDDIDEAVVIYYDMISKMSVYIVWVPLFLLSFLLVFIICNCRKIFPALFTFLYFVAFVIFCILSFCFMLLGVISVLTCGEVELQNRKLPGVLQWYVVPVCEKNSFFPALKKQFADAEAEKVAEACLKLLDVCDDRPITQQFDPISLYMNPNFFKDSKLFNCSLKPSTMPSICKDLEILEEIIDGIRLKSGLPWEYICTKPNCTIGSCSEECVHTLRPYGVFIKEAMEFGKRIGNAIRRVFIHSDCDIFLTRAMKAMSQCHLLSKGCFLTGSGLGLGALMLWFGIILQFKGQKLFFPTPK